jgi:hypothetical protein
MNEDVESTPERPHLFDQTNGVAGVASEREDRSTIDRAAQEARGAALGATGAAGWGR